ncbi:MAG: hypothetical protein KF752_01740 [Pirellulaceae bacterium]|nr:hypothetical protein [Pirellulaceae bacterium]
MTHLRAQPNADGTAQHASHSHASGQDVEEIIAERFDHGVLSDGDGTITTNGVTRLTFKCKLVDQGHGHGSASAQADDPAQASGQLTADAPGAGWFIEDTMTHIRHEYPSWYKTTNITHTEVHEARSKQQFGASGTLVDDQPVWNGGAALGKKHKVYYRAATLQDWSINGGYDHLYTQYTAENTYTANISSDQPPSQSFAIFGDPHVNVSGSYQRGLPSLELSTPEALVFVSGTYGPDARTEYEIVSSTTVTPPEEEP